MSTAEAVLAAVWPLAALTALVVLWQVRARRRGPDLDVPPELADDLAPVRPVVVGGGSREAPGAPDHVAMLDEWAEGRWL